MFVLVGALTVLQAQTMRPACQASAEFNLPIRPQLPQPATPAALGTPTRPLAPPASSPTTGRPTKPIGPAVAPVVTFRDGLLTVQGDELKPEQRVTAIPG